MKILIVGAGIIGSIFGWALADGNEVTHLVRSGRAAHFAGGMEIDIIDRRPGMPSRRKEHYAILAREDVSPAEHFDLVIVPTKHFTLERTLQQVAPFTRSTDTLLLTQNWQGTASLEPWLEKGHYLFGDAKAGGCFRGAELICAIKAIDIGAPDDASGACLEHFTELFRTAQIPVHTQEQMMPYLWIQYAMTGGMWPALVRSGSFKKALRDTRNIQLIFSCVRECLNVVAARGVDLSQFPATDMYRKSSPLTPLIAGMALSLMFRFDEYQKRCSLHALNDPQEVRTFYFDLLHSGQELKVPMPTFASFEPDLQNFTQPGQAW